MWSALAPPITKQKPFSYRYKLFCPATKAVAAIEAIQAGAVWTERLIMSLGIMGLSECYQALKEGFSGKSLLSSPIIQHTQEGPWPVSKAPSWAPELHWGAERTAGEKLNGFAERGSELLLPLNWSFKEGKRGSDWIEMHSHKCLDWQKKKKSCSLSQSAN